MTHVSLAGIAAARSWSEHEPTKLFKSPIDRRLGQYDHFIVHCSATHPNQDVDAEWIDRAHRKRGFTHGCGYHVVITREGKIQSDEFYDPCRKIGAPGAHVGGCGPGWNSRSFGVCMVGGVNTDFKPADNFTVVQFKALRDVYLDFFNSHPTQQVWTGGHRDLIAKTDAPGKKACPSFDFKTWERMCQLPLRVKMRDGEDLADTQSQSPIDLAEGHIHVVQPGETISQIKRLYGVTTRQLMQLNPDLVPNKIKTRQIVRIM